LVPVLQRFQIKETWVPDLQRYEDQRIPESKKHGFQIFKDTRIKETWVPKNSRIKEKWVPDLQGYKDQRNMGSSSSPIPESKKHWFQFFEQKSESKNHHQLWVFQKLESRWVFMKELAKNRQFFDGFFHSFTF
jgi:hypothetical protein